MITDKENTFEDHAAITVTRISDSIDLSVAQDISRSHGESRVRATVREAFTAAGAATLNAQFVEADASDLTTGQNVLWAPAAVIPKATLVAGYVIADIPLPRVAKRYCGWVWTVATGPMLTGKVDAGIVANSETAIADRPSNFNTGF